jgi:hypothetical protein
MGKRLRFCEVIEVMLNLNFVRAEPVEAACSERSRRKPVEAACSERSRRKPVEASASLGQARAERCTHRRVVSTDKKSECKPKNDS